MNVKSFKCALCGEDFMSAAPDAEAIAEYEARFGCEWRAEDVIVVCDDCDEMVMQDLRDNPAFRAEIEAETGPIDIDAKPARVM